MAVGAQRDEIIVVVLSALLPRDNVVYFNFRVFASVNGAAVSSLNEDAASQICWDGRPIVHFPGPLVDVRKSLVALRLIITAARCKESYSYVILVIQLMSTDSKIKHLEFIQAVINRMSANSFLLKGWSVTLVAALFALAAKDANPKYVVIAYLPVLIFWLIDGYFLSQERLFRALYDDTRRKNDDEIDFSMDVRNFLGGRNSWPRAFFASTLVLFYASLIVMMLIIMYLLRP